MPLTKSVLAELLMERIYDVLWRAEYLADDLELEELKAALRQDIHYQINIIENELKEKIK